MYIDTVPNRDSPPTILIRESYREDGKVRKRTIANITKLPEDVIEQIRALLRGSVVADAPGEGLQNAFKISRAVSHGDACAVLAALRTCGIDKAIDPRRSPARDLAVAMVALRILEPGSKLASARGFRPETASSTLAAQLKLPEDVGEDRLYEVMDWLLRGQPRIEKALAEKHSEERKPVLYDLTSTWSYSRDRKRGLPQIEFGLLCDGEGRPVAVEAFTGNASDSSTAASQIRKLRDRFGLEKVVFVGDRGMTAQARIREDLEPNGFNWVFALRAPAIRSLAESGALQPSLFDEQDMAEIECEEKFPGERLVVCRNPLLAEDRTRKRQELIAATAAELEAVRRKNRPARCAEKIRRRAEKILKKRKMQKHFELKISESRFSWKRKKTAIAAEAALDGLYVIRTSVPKDEMTAAEAVLACKSLGKVERAFRTMKAADIEVRPIRHRLEHRVRAHLLICMLAYCVEMHMRKALAPMLFDDEDGPVRESPVAKTERSAGARKKAATKRARSGLDVHDFRGVLRHLGKLTMNRITPAGSKAREFDLPLSPTPIQAKALRLLNAQIDAR